MEETKAMGQSLGINWAVRTHSRNSKNFETTGQEDGLIYFYVGGGGPTPKYSAYLHDGLLLGKFEREGLELEGALGGPHPQLVGQKLGVEQPLLPRVLRRGLARLPQGLEAD